MGLAPTEANFGSKDDEGAYYLIYPTDYQAYAEIPMIRSEYDAMWSEIDFVSQNSYSFIFHTDPVG